MATDASDVIYCSTKYIDCSHEGPVRAHGKEHKFLVRFIIILCLSTVVDTENIQHMGNVFIVTTFVLLRLVQLSPFLSLSDPCTSVRLFISVYFSLFPWKERTQYMLYSASM